MRCRVERGGDIKVELKLDQGSLFESISSFALPRGIFRLERSGPRFILAISLDFFLPLSTLVILGMRVPGGRKYVSQTLDLSMKRIVR
jgi:hypothetical protein